MEPPTERASTAGRDIWLDTLRGLAIVGVVLEHAALQHLPSAVISSTRLGLVHGYFELPLLVFVSGYLACRRSATPRSSWVASKAKRLLVPYFAWAVVFYFAADFPTTGLGVFDTSGSLAEYLIRIVVHPHNALWYLWTLFLLAAIVAIVEPWLRAGSLRSALGAVVALAIPSMLLMGLRVLGWEHGAFGMRLGLQHMPFFLAGYFWRMGSKALRFPKAAAVVPIALWFALVVWFPRFLQWFRYEVETGPGLAGELSAYATSFVADWVLGFFGLAFGVAMAQWLEPLLGRSLAYVGVSALGVYAANYLLVGIGWGPWWLATTIAFAVALAGSLLLTRILRRSRISAGVFLGEWD